MVKGLAHITGGGITENVPRMLPDHLTTEFDMDAYTPPPVFGWMQEVGNVETAEMLRTFNMGVGMVLCVAPGLAVAALEKLKSLGEDAFIFGKLVDV